MTQASDALDLIETLGRTSTTDAVLDEMRSVLARFGFEYFCFASLPRPRQSIRARSMRPLSRSSSPPPRRASFLTRELHSRTVGRRTGGAYFDLAHFTTGSDWTPAITVGESMMMVRHNATNGNRSLF